MQRSSCLFTVRPIGFEAPEAAQLAALLAGAPGAGPSYSCLHADSLQEPDLLIANGDNPGALAHLACQPPDLLHPVLMIGGSHAGAHAGTNGAATAQPEPAPAPWPALHRPLDCAALHHTLADLLDTRVHALAQQGASARRLRAERRPRPALDGETPAFYTRRRPALVDGAVLIIDKQCALRDQVARLLAPRRIRVEWTDSPCAAVRLCDETTISLVLINTAAAGIEPYGLCSSITSQEGAGRTRVVFLVEPSFHYDSARARLAGARGLLETPVAGRHLMPTFRKLLDLPV